jgi:hypothetical protein
MLQWPYRQWRRVPSQVGRSTATQRSGASTLVLLGTALASARRKSLNGNCRIYACAVTGVPAQDEAAGIPE